MCASNEVSVCIKRKKEQWRLNDNRKSAVRRINNDSSI